MACGDRRAMPVVAILDPELTLTCPPGVTASAGVDALSHAVESFVTTARNPVSRELSIQAWKLLSSNLERVLTSPRDLEARAGMLYGASHAGAAIEHSMLGAAHAAANPVSARYRLVHGQAVGLLLPHIVRFNSSVSGDDYGELLSLAGRSPSTREGPGEALASWLESLLRLAGFPRRLRDVGVGPGDCQELSLGATQQWTGKFNPRPVAAGDFEELYRNAL
jgi:alcohol dehydrogenase